MTKTIKNLTRERKGGFLCMLLSTLGASLLGDLLTKNLSEKGTVRAREGFLRAGKITKKKSINATASLTNFETQEYYKSEPRLNGVYSRDNLPKTIKIETAYTVNLDNYKNTRTHWIALYVKNKEITYFDSFGVEHFPKEIKKIH